MIGSIPISRTNQLQLSSSEIHLSRRLLNHYFHYKIIGVLNGIDDSIGGLSSGIRGLGSGIGGSAGVIGDSAAALEGIPALGTMGNSGVF